MLKHYCQSCYCLDCPRMKLPRNSDYKDRKNKGWCDRCDTCNKEPLESFCAWKNDYIAKDNK